MWQLIIAVCIAAQGGIACALLDPIGPIETKAGCDAAFVRSIPAILDAQEVFDVAIVDIAYVCEQMGEGV